MRNGILKQLMQLVNILSIKFAKYLKTQTDIDLQVNPLICDIHHFKFFRGLFKTRVTHDVVVK